MEIPHPNTESYLKNQLSIEDKNTFENLMLKHPALAEDVANEKLSINAIDKLIADELRSTLIKTPRTEAKVIGFNKKNQRWAVAAGFLILIFAGLFINKSQRTFDADVYASNNIVLVEKEQKTKGIAVTIKTNPPKDEFIKAQEQYAAKNYEEALNQYLQIYKLPNLSPEDKDITDWNVIMCKIKMGQLDQAKSLLIRIQSDELHYYYDESIDLLDKL